MNTYRTSSGERLSKSTIDLRIRKAKEAKLYNFFRKYGFFFCEECKINEKSAGKLDCSHTISVKEAQDSGKSELAYDEKNIKLRCRACHNKLDKNGVQWS